MRMKDPSRVQVVHPNLLLYGAPKTGKTTAAASMAGGILYLNLDLDNATHYARLQDAEGRIMEPEFDGVATLSEVETEARKSDPIMDVVVIDPVGDLHRKLLEQESRLAVRPSRDAYGDVAIRVERFCRAICDAPNVSCVIVAHDNPVKDEVSGSLMAWPWTGTANPALGRKLMSMVDVIAYTGVVQPIGDDGQSTGAIEFWAQLVSANGRIAGSRWPALLGKKRLMGRLLPDGMPDLEVHGLAGWVEAINENAATVAGEVQV